MHGSGVTCVVDEREPEVDAVLLEDGGHLVELLADERCFVGHRGKIS